jgi:diaminopimelate epimerase
MRVPFVKMHGLGNDFVVLDARVNAIPAMTMRLAAALADRHTGIGCDQLILLDASTSADFRMRIFNHDGGEVEACGNATRAVALLHGEPARIETLGGELLTKPANGGIGVDMGAPRFEWQQIPLAYAMDTHSLPIAWEALENPTAINVGNPHVVFFVADCEDVELDRLGPVIEHDLLFPERVNVNIATVENRELIRLRVWERGVGETLACGTGACATAIGAMRRGLTGRAVTVRLIGGDLRIEWTADDRIHMTGPAAESFRGSFESADFDS